jgi:hypothetical protein
MTEDQLAVIRYAYCDLMGSKEAADMGKLHAHDWMVHGDTIKDMEKHFAKELIDLIHHGKKTKGKKHETRPV